MTDYNDDYDDELDPDNEPDFGDSEHDQTEPSVSEEMLFALIKQAKEQQANANALIERLSDLATTLQAQEQGRETRINNAIDDLKNLDLQGIVSDTTKKAVGELVNAELAKGVSQFITVQNSKLEQNSREIGKANNILIDNIDSFAKLMEQLKKDETDVLQNNVAKQVEKGVFEGVKQGLQDVTAGINGYLDNVGEVVNDGANKLIKASQKSNEVFEAIDDYAGRVMNRKHWYLIGSVLGFLLIFIPLYSFICYQMAISKMPSDGEIKQAQMQLSSLQQQNQYLQQALTTSLYTYKDSNLYYRVDKSKCIDYNNQNYCMSVK